MSAIAGPCLTTREMKKSPKSSRPARPLQQLSPASLALVTGGGLSGPDPCDGQYKIRCVQEITPPDIQEC